MHSRGLWLRWMDNPTIEERVRFMFASYNAGEGTILRARSVARMEQLDERTWQNIEVIAPKVQRWRYRETLPYVRKIEDNHSKLKSQVRRSSVAKSAKTTPNQ
jgi:membrane-bound lytic murein transglycosylase MltF